MDWASASQRSSGACQAASAAGEFVRQAIVAAPGDSAGGCLFGKAIDEPVPVRIRQRAGAGIGRLRGGRGGRVIRAPAHGCGGAVHEDEERLRHGELSLPCGPVHERLQSAEIDDPAWGGVGGSRGGTRCRHPRGVAHARRPPGSAGGESTAPPERTRNDRPARSSRAALVGPAAVARAGSTGRTRGAWIGLLGGRGRGFDFFSRPRHSAARCARRGYAASTCPAPSPADGHQRSVR